MGQTWVGQPGAVEDATHHLPPFREGGEGRWTWRILELLKRRKDNGQPKAFGGKEIADTLGLIRGQNAVCDAISNFRKRVVQLLADEGIKADNDSVVITGKAGYQIIR